ncbi:hypothetical protein F4859DRAFT_38046 [Xylaria cf. heliscus]|nr:hypothetical protein F4859DRAFT_38046 [Xylaria cf. heliscus]
MGGMSLNCPPYFLSPFSIHVFVSCSCVPIPLLFVQKTVTTPTSPYPPFLSLLKIVTRVAGITMALMDGLRSQGGLVGWLAGYLAPVSRDGSALRLFGSPGQLFISLRPRAALRSAAASLPTHYRHELGERGGGRPDQEFTAVVAEHQKGGRREGNMIMLFGRKIRFIIGFSKPPSHIVVVMWK